MSFYFQVPSLQSTSSMKLLQTCQFLHLFCFVYMSLSQHTQIVGVRSRSRRTKPITKRTHGNVHCYWFIFPLLLPTPAIWFSHDHKRNVSDRVVRGVGRNGNVLLLLTPIPSRLRIHLRLRFLIFTRS